MADREGRPWTWQIETDDGSRVQIKFFNTANGKEATFSLSIRSSGGYQLKQEGDGYPEVSKTV
ncbi:MAG: hypothetical protein R2695_08820 [Acidimicrobiales bacterium]